MNFLISIIDRTDNHHCPKDGTITNSEKNHDSSYGHKFCDKTIPKKSNNDIVINWFFMK